MLVGKSAEMQSDFLVPYRLFLVQKNKKCSDKSNYLRAEMAPWLAGDCSRI